MRREKEKSTKAKKDGPYLIRDVIIITDDEIAQAADISVRKSLAASLTFGLVEGFKQILIEILLEVVWKVAAKCGKNVPDTDVRLVSVKPGYMMEAIFRR